MGAASLTMTILAGLAKQLDEVVLSGASLFLRLAPRSERRLRVLVPLAKPFMDGINPQWAARAPTLVTGGFGAARRRLVRDHHPLTAAAAFCFGGEREALWRRDNLDEATLAWAGREFGYAPFRCLEQVRKSAGRPGISCPRASSPRSTAISPGQAARRHPHHAARGNREPAFFLPEGQQKTRSTTCKRSSRTGIRSCP